MAIKVTAVFLLLCLVLVSAQTEIDVLNFALNLECLEAQFYSYAAYGVGLSLADRGGGPAPIGGKKAKLSPEAQYYAESIAQDEIKHVRFLRAALGPAAIPCPRVDIGTAFAMAADFAFDTILPSGIKFDPYADDLLFYHGAFIFEDVGVTAYKGAAGFLKTPAYLTAAAGILAVEAYHGGSIRTKLLGIKDNFVFPYAVTVTNIVDAISALRGRAVDRGIFVNGTYIIAPTDENAIAFSRTPKEVLNVVYLGQKPYGGFFPYGLNGNVK